jgi:hypothetical protein
MLASPFSASAFLDLAIPSSSTIGYLCLLSGATFQGSATVDITDSSLTTAIPHNLQTGTRLKLQTSQALPVPLNTTATYYAKVLSATKLQLATSIAALNQPIQLLNAGTGTLTINELALNNTDPVSVLVNKELLLSTVYNRPALTNIGMASALTPTSSAKPGKEIIIRNELNTSISFAHQLIIFGGTQSPRTTTDIVHWLLQTEATPTVMAPNEVRSFTTKLELRLGS